MSDSIKACFRLDYGGFCLNVDLSLPGAGVTVLFGPSGSGKTTLLRCVAGLQKAPAGFLRIHGEVWQDSAQSLFLPTHKRALGYVFQEANLFPHLTVADNLAFGLQRIGKRAQPADLSHILGLLGIAHLLPRMPVHLSGGERQRVAIARALALNPKILLMDEPLASLDFKRKQDILPFLNRLHAELQIPMLYVTHSRQEVAQLADHLVIMDEGRVLASGALADTLSRLDVPLAQDRDAATVWPVKIIAHEADYHLTRVAFAGGTISLPQVAAEPGTPLRIMIYARDVSITLQEPMATSILNVLPAVITGMMDDDQGHCTVQLQLTAMSSGTCDSAQGLPLNLPSLLAHITCKSKRLLELRSGMSVYVQIKGTSILN